MLGLIDPGRVPNNCGIREPQKRENPVISDWVRVSEGSTEGLLGGWLAQRQAALRDVMAAGAHPTFTLGLLCVPVISRAACVPQEIFFGSGEEFNLLLSRSAATMRCVSENLVAEFYQSKMIFESNYPYALSRRNDCAVFRSSAPQLSAHHHGTLRIEFRIDLSNLANQLDVAGAGFLVEIESGYQKRRQRGDSG